MRIITEKDKQGLLVAFRVFFREYSGERISQKAGLEMLSRALENGISFDALLCKENWGKALELMPSLSAKDYIDMLCERRFDITEIKDSHMWHLPDNGFVVVAEAAHDFFMEITGKGGKWNIPSALKNLAKAIEKCSLQAILSEKLINEIATSPDMTFFGYIQAIADDFKSLPIEDEPTEAQTREQERQKELIDSLIETNETERPVEENDEAEPDENDQYPEYEEPEPGSARTEFETAFIMQGSPREMKRDTLRNALEGYTPMELAGLIKTITGGESMVVSEVIDALVDGCFNPSLETPDAKQIHLSISADLLPSFIDCVRMQGVEMDEKTAAGYDILHDSWDLRTQEVRKLHKLKKLIITYGKDDPDLGAAMADIENLYSEKE